MFSVAKKSALTFACGCPAALLGQVRPSCLRRCAPRSEARDPRRRSRGAGRPHLRSDALCRPCQPRGSASGRAQSACQTSVKDRTHRTHQDANPPHPSRCQQARQHTITHGGGTWGETGGGGRERKRSGHTHHSNDGHLWPPVIRIDLHTPVMGQVLVY